MNSKPQTIQIFLPDGSPTSIKEAEITNRLVKALFFPRNKLQEVAKRELIHFTGVYFLFGNSEEDAKPIVYIGEGEDCYTRILSHNRLKDFWTHAVVIATKTDEYTKTDSKFLEYYCIEQAQHINRYELDNNTGSRKPSLPESREYDLLDNFETIKVLLATLGYPIFEEKRKSKDQKELFYCQVNDANATAELIDEGILVHKGSICSAKTHGQNDDWAAGLRSKLIEQKVIMQIGANLVFQSDHIFNSPSTAAVTVLGRRANGWTTWKDKQGRTLDELKRK